MFKELTLKLQN